MKDISQAHRILVIGDSGRGKTTFAIKLAAKLSLPLHSTDDYFWKTKFTVPNDRQESVSEIQRMYETDRWIVEGSSMHLIKPGLERADVILDLRFRNIFEQWASLIRRNKGRDNEDIWPHLVYVTKKRFGIGNDKEKQRRELIAPYRAKIIKLDSYQALDAIIERKSGF